MDMPGFRLQTNKRSSSARFAGLLLFALVVSLLLAPAAISAQGEPDRVAINKDLVIEKGDVAHGDVSVTNGNLKVYGEVLGKVTVVTGDADIEGTVRGDVVVTNGNLNLGRQSVVEGNVLTVVGKLNRDPGAVVKGKVDVAGLPFAPGSMAAVARPGAAQAPERMAVASTFDRLVGLFGRGMVSLLMLLLGVALTAVIPRRARISSDTLETEPGPSIALGLITAFLLGPVVGVLTLVLAISIVGVVLIPVLVVLVALALLFGLVVVSTWLGGKVYETAHQGPGNRHEPPILVEMLLGMAVVLASTLIPSVFMPAWTTFLMWFLLYFAASIGLGAVILSRLGTLVPPKRAHVPVGLAGYIERVSAHQNSQEQANTAPLGSAPVLPTDGQSSR
ncbi:MAG: polymer-forming cytoskeletal protein [Chloroflexota bacterium]|nr:polymer-forming cytoskeletal protein [Chloroflexota bacterium]